VTRRRVSLVAVLTAVVLVTAIVVVFLVRGGGEEDANGAPADSLERFYGQELSWSDCDEGKCAKVEVPIDYEKPDGETLELAVKVIPAKGDGGRSLFVNPGGPGGGVTGFTEYMAEILGQDVLDQYDIVGVDPRGIGESTPVDCVSDRELDQFFAKDPSPDDADEVAQYREITAGLGAGCGKESGGLGAHISTEEAARDFDVVRALLKSKTFDWFGFSYGTQLGATYASLFPEKVGRMVLDGALDTSLSYLDILHGQSTGFDRALRAYAKDCLAQDDCPLEGDVDAALRQISDFLEATDSTPVTTDEDRELTEGLAYIGIFYPLYAEELWPELSTALRAGFDGDGAPLLGLADAYTERDQDGYVSNYMEMYYAVSCLDSAERGSFDDAESEVARFEKANPVLGRLFAWDGLVCADWPIPATHPQEEVDATGSKPIVVIGTTRDPATPYEWSQTMVDQLGTGVLISREGDGHTAYGSGNSCIDDLVDTYLADGTVPKDGTTCKE